MTALFYPISDMLDVKVLGKAQWLYNRLRSAGVASLSPEAGKRWSHRLASVAFVMILLPVTARLADLTWELLPEPEGASAEVKRRQVSGAKAGPASLDVSVVIDAHLFGQAGKSAPKRTRMVDAPETKLNLELVGVYFAEDKQKTLAIIGAKGSDHTVYGVGATLPGAATVEEIHADKVLLRRDGRLEVLKLRKDAQKGESLTKAKPKSDDRKSRRVDYRANRQLSKMLGRYQRKVRSDPMSLSELVQVEPARQGESIVGYKIRPGKDPRLLGRFGLRPGDVVVSVNGVSLSGPEGMSMITGELMNAENVNLEVLRAGRKLAFLYKVE